MILVKVHSIWYTKLICHMFLSINWEGISCNILKITQSLKTVLVPAGRVDSNALLNQLSQWTPVVEWRVLRESYGAEISLSHLHEGHRQQCLKIIVVHLTIFSCATRSNGAMFTPQTLFTVTWHCLFCSFLSVYEYPVLHGVLQFVTYSMCTTYWVHIRCTVHL